MTFLVRGEGVGGDAFKPQKIRSLFAREFFDGLKASPPPPPTPSPRTKNVIFVLFSVFFESRLIFLYSPYFLSKIGYIFKHQIYLHKGFDIILFIIKSSMLIKKQKNDAWTPHLHVNFRKKNKKWSLTTPLTCELRRLMQDNS